MDDALDEYGAQQRAELERLIRDAQSERVRHEDQWTRNVQLFHGAHRTALAAGSKLPNYFTSNQTQASILVQVAVMTEKAVRPIFVPRETNEPPEIFLRPESAYKVPQGGGLSDEQMAGAEVIPEPLFDFLASQTVKQTQPNPRAGEMIGTGENAKPQPDEVEVDVPIFSDEDFIFVDDALCAEALTQEHDSEWEMAGGDEVLRHAITAAMVVGHQDLLVQWREQESRIELMPLYPFNCWIDRWATSPRDAEYFILLQVKPLSEAMRDFPDAAEMLQASKTTAGGTTWWGGASGDKYSGTTERDVVEIFTCWKRHRPYPMDPQDALDRGLIRQAQEEPLIDPDTNALVDPGGMVIPDQYVSADSGEPVQPGGDNWPVRYGIHQLTMVGNHILYEGETEFADIPVGRIKNIPVIESPHGQGEPQRLESLQDLKNRLWSIFFDYCMFYRSPEQAMPASVMNALEEKLKTMHSNAGRKIAVPDDLWIMFQGQILNTVPIPQLSDTFAVLMRMVTDEMNQISGTVDVLRGEAKSEWSGELFSQATNAARGPIGYKARGVSEAIKHAAKVSAGLIIDFLPLDEWAKRNKKYPPQILEVMRRRLKRIGYDVSVEVGGASSRDTDAQRLSVALQNSPMLLDSPTFMKQYAEAMNIKDGDKIVREVQQARAMQAAAPTQA